ncbi:MAG: phosphotransferase [Patescibacteria group bacterium]|nr:phosphotransferase [Patescibacteria group bacterium]
MASTGNILIPNIGKKIAAVLRREKLRPAVTPHKFLARVKSRKHRYFTAAKTRDGQTVAFYARLHQNPDAQRKFLTEIAVLGRLNRLTAPFARTVPKLYDHHREKDFEWFTREHVNGTALGHSRDLEIKPTTATARQLADIIAAIGGIQPKNLGVRLPAFNPNFYIIDRQCYGLSRETALPSAACRGITRLVVKNHRLLVAENRYLSHGDLNLGNIIIENGQVRIVDWELAQHNNFAYDIGYLWVHLWQAPRSFRRQLMTSYLRHLDTPKTRLFHRLLPVVVAFLAIGGIPYRVSLNERHAEQQRRRRYHITLLESCLKGFGKLINT